MEYHLTLQEIRKRCRMAMNGDASAGMRKYGLVYKLNFGLMISQVKEIAKHYQQDAQLASVLWEQETRELKILATLLHPIREFSEEQATKWAMEIPNQEIREQISINLFQELAVAEKLSLEWACNENPSLRTTGYWLLGRLLLTKKINALDNLCLLPHIWKDIITEDTYLRNAALFALKQIGRHNKEISKGILSKITTIESSSTNELLIKEIYDSLVFEFEYFA